MSEVVRWLRDRADTYPILREAADVVTAALAERDLASHAADRARQQKKDAEHSLDQARKRFQQDRQNLLDRLDGKQTLIHKVVNLIESVKDLHVATQAMQDPEDYTVLHSICDECGKPWPCPTREALNG